MKDLYDKYQKQHHKIELKELKRFLELSGSYTQRLQIGETVDAILDDIKRKNDIYEFKLLRKTELEEIPWWKKKDINKELDALTYAYAKLDDENRVETDNEIIKDKIKEMSIR